MGTLKWFWRHKKISLILIILTAVAVWWFFIRNQNGDLEEAALKQGEVVEKLILPGLVEADEHAQLTFATSGKIAWINVEEGEKVSQGKALAKLDTTALNSAYQRALSDLRAQEANVAEVLDDVKDNDADENFDEKNTRTAAEVAKDKAYEAVIIAEENLRNATLFSPFDGFVTYIAHPYSGINVLATETQIEVINPETIHFKVAADQTEVSEIEVGDLVTVILDSMQEKEILGRVSYVSYSLSNDALASVYEVEVDFSDLKNSDFAYRVGMTGDVHFVLNKKENVKYVPSGFTKSDDEGDYLLTNAGKDKVYVKVGLEGEDRTEVVTDLKVGTLIYD